MCDFFRLKELKNCFKDTTKTLIYYSDSDLSSDSSRVKTGEGNLWGGGWVGGHARSPLKII